MDNFRLIIDKPLPGPWNMAVDEVLLGDAVENDIATLRLYEWSEPTLSLGYFQRYADRERHAASRDCAIVRRQSGGGAILHDRELTYSLALPASQPLARHAGDLYERVHNAFIAVLSAGRPSIESQSTLRIRGDTAEPPSATEPFLCFQRQSPGDVILIPGNRKTAASEPGWKVLGSAQRRHRGAILQHGSLLMEMSQAAPELPGLRDLDGPNLPMDTLTAAVCAQLSAVLGVRMIPSSLPSNLESRATEVTNNKYGSPVWTKRR